MPSLTVFQRQFTPSWLISLLALFIFLLFIRLGFWQIARAHEKQLLLQQATEWIHRVPLLWQPTQPAPSPYRPVSVTGELLPTIFLLDNQHHDHQFGYDVLMGLRLANDQVVMLDYGWIKGDQMRQQFPIIQLPRQIRQTVQGYTYYPSAKQWVLGQAFEKKRADLVVIEQINVKIIEQFLHKSVYPFIIRLYPEQSVKYRRDWPIVAMPPERHYGYAVQWFAMALAVLILWLALNWQRKQ